MAWTHEPSRRNDILLETGNELLDGSGNYTSPWIETSGVYTIRVAARFAGTATVKVEESVYDTDHSDPSGGHGAVRTQDVGISVNPAYAELSLTARYFRLVVTGGPSSGTFKATVRAV